MSFVSWCALSVAEQAAALDYRGAEDDYVQEQALVFAERVCAAAERLRAAVEDVAA